MTKKYSMYNCYRNLKTMLSYKEAVEKIDSAATVSVDELIGIEAKVELYNRVFFGYENTENQKADFTARRRKILDGLTEDEKKDYAENLQKAIADGYDEACKEYLSRNASVSRSSKEGIEEGKAFDQKEMEAKAANKYQETKFCRLFNIPVPRIYKGDDSGVYIWDEKECDYIRISQAITIKSIEYSKETCTEYLTVQYYNYRSDEIIEMCLPSETLAKNSYESLISSGIVIENAKLFTKYLNAIKTANQECKRIPDGQANMCYGYPVKEDGTLDLDSFIGLDEKHKIVPIKEYAALDKAIFCERGTTQGFIDFLDEVSKGKYTIDFQILVAASLVGITQAYVNNGMDVVAPPTYIFIGQTTIGKNLMAAIANNVWASPNDTCNLIYSSESSKAFLGAMKHRIQYLPLIIADVQDLIDNSEWGIAGVTEMVFQHANGATGGKATTNGEMRNNWKHWHNPEIFFNEHDCFSNNGKITGGADARYTIIPLRVADGDKLTVRSPKSYALKEKMNFGVLGKAYIIAMKNETSESVAERFFEITEELEQLGVQEKQANSLGMLVLTDELARKYGLFPKSWDVLDTIRLIDWVGAKKITDPIETMYRLISEHVFKDKSFVPSDDDYFKANEKSVFDSRCKTPYEVRGRILWQKKNEKGEFVECRKEERERSLLLIPNRQLQDLFKYLETETGLKGFGFDKRKWTEKGWLLKNSNNEYMFKDTFKISITRPRDSRNRESYYAIVLYEDADVSVAAQDYEEKCLETMKKTVGREVNRTICEECTDTKCAYVQNKSKGA